jgi:hypothetical protein
MLFKFLVEVGFTSNVHSLQKNFKLINVCLVNEIYFRLMMTKLKDYDPDFQSKWSAILNHNSSKLNDSNIRLV